MVRKAQVALFIIIGLVLVAAAGVIYFINSDAQPELQTEIEGVAVAPGQQELRTFMDSCISEAAYQGLEILRLQAGFIDIPEGISTTRVPSGMRLVSDEQVKKLVASQNGYIDVPFWLDSRNRLTIPSLDYMEVALADYVHASVTQCVDGFSAFKAQNYGVTEGPLQVSVDFSDEVLFSITYPLAFAKEDVSFSERSFIFRLPISMEKAVSAARDIVMGEDMGAFLETNIKDLINVYSYGGAERKPFTLPPMSHAEASTSCSMQTWQFDDVKRNFYENILQNSQYFDVKKNQDFYDRYVVPVLSEDYPGVNVSFKPNSDGYYFDIGPRSGSLIRPNRHTSRNINFLPIFCNMRYQFKYTARVPMISTVTLAEDPSLDIIGKRLNKEMPFSFGVPIGVYLCGNQERRCTGESPYVQPALELEAAVEEQVQSTFCDLDKRLSNPLQINVVDLYTNQPVDDVALFYSCVRDECMIDVSKEGKVEASLPLCFNGQLFGIKDGYAQNKEYLTTNAGTEKEEVTLEIEPLKELALDIKLVDVPRFIGNYYMSEGFTRNRCTGEIISPTDNNLAASRVGDKTVFITSEDGPVAITAAYPDTRSIKIASGNYILTSLVQGKVNIELPTIDGKPISFEQSGISSIRGVGGISEEDLAQARAAAKNQLASWQEEQNFPLGSYTFAASIPLEDLKSASRIQFYIPVETTGSTLNIGQQFKIQQNGSLSMTGDLDIDCNGEPEYVAIEIPKNEVQRILQPRVMP